MFLRLIRYRLKTEWLRFLLGLIFAVIIFSWYGTANIVSDETRSFNGYVTYYQILADQEARSKGLPSQKQADKSDLREGYELLLRENRGYLYACLILSVNDWTPPLTVIPLAVLFLTSLFQKKRLGPLMAAGFSRRSVFFSLTGAYFLCIVLVWLFSCTYLLKRYCIEFTQEEHAFFLVTRLTWFCAFLWHATIAYLTAMLLRRPMPAFAAAVALWLIFGFTTRNAPNTLPSYIIDHSMSVKPLEPGADLWPMLRTDIVAAAFFVISIFIGWFSFRKRGLE